MRFISPHMTKIQSQAEIINKYMRMKLTKIHDKPVIWNTLKFKHKDDSNFTNQIKYLIHINSNKNYSYQMHHINFKCTQHQVIIICCE